MPVNKENDGPASLAASLVGGAGSSYVARLQRRQEMEKLRTSVAGKSVSERLMRKSQALRPARENSSNPCSRGSLPPTVPVSPLSSIAAAEATLDDAVERLQRELDGYDKKLQVLRSHVGVLPPVPLPPSAPASAAAAPTPPPAQHPRLPSGEQPIVRSVIVASGQGCKEVIAASAAAAAAGGRRKGSGAAAPPAPVWKTRAHKAPRTKSSCTLQLEGRRFRDVAIRITFGDAASVPALLCFEHAPAPAAAFSLLGQVPLQAKSTKQLKHVFRLGADVAVERCLRITALGHIAKARGAPGAPNAHAVTHLLVTGEPAPASPEPAASGASTAATPTVTATVRRAPAGAEDDTAESGPAEAEVEVRVSLDQPALAPAESAGAPAPAAAKKGESEALAAAASSAVKQEAVSRKSVAPRASLALPGAQQEGKGKVGAPLRGSLRLPASAASEAPAAAASLAAPSRSTTFKLPQDPAALAVPLPRQSVGPLPAQSDVSVDFSRLEAEFAAPRAAAVPAPAGPRLISAQRAADVAAVLARLGLTPEQARLSLLHVLGDEEDDGAAAPAPLGLEALEALLLCLPAADERAGLAAFEGSWEGLAPAERFMLGTLRVPALRPRLEAVIFLHGFDARAEAVAASAAAVTAAAPQVRASKLLRSVLKTAATIGAFLNGAAGRAFQVDGLLKLKEVKSTRARSRTLLHFLARETARRHPEGASLAAELPGAAAAARVSLAALRAELDALADGIEAAAAAGRAGGADPAQLDDLLALATDRLAGVNAGVVEADAAFMELRAVLAGKPATLEEPAPLFSLLVEFSTQLDAAHADNAAADGAAADGRPGSAPSSGSAPTAPQQQQGRIASAVEATPPAQHRDRVLATIKAYSKLTASQRQALLTEARAQDRLAALGITHRHSIAAAPGALAAAAAASAGASCDGPAEGASVCKPGAGGRRAAGVRSSAPAISLAQLLARSAAAPLPPVAEEAAEEAVTGADAEASQSPAAATVAAPEPTPEYSDEVQGLAETEEGTEEPSEDDEGADSDGPAAGAVSSPVARLLASSRSLVERSVALRSSAAAAPPPPPAPVQAALPAEAATAMASPRSDAGCSDVSFGSKCYSSEDVVSSEALSPQQTEDESPAAAPEPEPASPVTLRPVGAAAAARDPASPAGTPQVSWGRKSAGGRAPAAVPPSPGMAVGTTPDGAVLECSASLQPLPGLWRSTAETLLPELEGSPAAAASSAAGPCLTDDNPVASAPTASLAYHHGGAQALEDDAGSPQKAAGQRRAAAGDSLRCSTQWVRGSVEAAPPAAARASNKRVSFSLPASPCGSSSGGDDSAGGAAPAPPADVFDAVEDVEGAGGHGFVESPAGGLSSVPEEAPAAGVTQRRRRRGPDAAAPRHSASLAGVDLELAKQLVKNASVVRRSRQQQGRSAASGSAALQGTPASVAGGAGASQDPYAGAVALLPPAEASPAAPSEMSVQEAATAALTRALAEQLRRSLPGLPGVPSDALPALPLAASPGLGLNLDQIMAAIISNAGNTPTGPLARGVRGGDASIFDAAAVELLRAAAEARAAATAAADGAGGAPPAERKALLEPIVPAPLGMGVRVSETVAHGISPTTLRQGLEAHLRQVRLGGAARDAAPPAPSAALAGGFQAPAPTPAGTAMPAYTDEDAWVEAGGGAAHQGSSVAGGVVVAAAASAAAAPGQSFDLQRAEYLYNYGPDYQPPAAEPQQQGGRDDGGLSLELLGLESQRRSKGKSGSARQVNSSLAMERLERWGSLKGPSSASAN